MRFVSLCALAALLTPSLTASAKQPAAAIEGAVSESVRPPWRARVRIPGRGYVRGFALVDPSIMPSEPALPDGAVDAKRFARALETLCHGRLDRKKAAVWARALIRSGRDFDVDPFVVAALIRRESGCSEAAPGKRAGKNTLGSGIARIRYEIHRPFIKDGAYHYWIKQGRIWQPRQLAVGRYAFTPKTLRRADVSIYFASALLAVYSEQASDLDEAFPQLKHRHPISHLLWGDRVRGTEGEERILRDRRAMLAYYQGQPPPAKGRYKDLTLRCPLDGAPRKITSGFNARRGWRRHSGLDFYSQTGEPVRAIADGVVYFSGYQRRRGLARSVSPKYSRHVRRWRMGIGGLFVLLRHEHKLQSGYFHLRDFTVRSGQRVKAGDVIGHVGRTGIRSSPAHLHFELRRNNYRINPLRYLRGEVLPLTSTYFGRHVSAPRYRWSPRLARAHRRAVRLARLRRAKRARRRRATASRKRSVRPLAAAVAKKRKAAPKRKAALKRKATAKRKAAPKRKAARQRRR